MRGEVCSDQAVWVISVGRVKLLAVDAQLERELNLPQLLRFRPATKGGGAALRSTIDKL